MLVDALCAREIGKRGCRRDGDLLSEHPVSETGRHPERESSRGMGRVVAGQFGGWKSLATTLGRIFHQVAAILRKFIHFWCSHVPGKYSEARGRGFREGKESREDTWEPARSRGHSQRARRRCGGAGCIPCHAVALRRNSSIFGALVSRGKLPERTRFAGRGKEGRRSSGALWNGAGISLEWCLGDGLREGAAGCGGDAVYLSDAHGCAWDIRDWPGHGSGIGLEAGVDEINRLLLFVSVLFAVAWMCSFARRFLGWSLDGDVLRETAGWFRLDWFWDGKVRWGDIGGWGGVLETGRCSGGWGCWGWETRGRCGDGGGRHVGDVVWIVG